MFTDPTGMSKFGVENEYLIARDGKVTEVQKEGNDVIIILDDKGNRTDKTVDIGSGNTFIDNKENGQMLMINDQSKAKEAFTTISDNVKAEYGLIRYDDHSDNNKKAILATQSSTNSVNADDIGIALDKSNTVTVTDIDHSHPQGSPPSGYYSNSNEFNGSIINKKRPIGDSKGAIEYPTNNRGEIINRRVYLPNRGEAIRYDNKRFYPTEKY